MSVLTVKQFDDKKDEYFKKKSEEDDEIFTRDRIPHSVTEYMLEQTAKVCFDEMLLEREHQDQKQFIEKLSQKVGEKDSLFTTKPFNCGSAYERVKINAPDEFDHIFELQETFINSSTVDFEEFELPTSKPTKYKDIKHRSYFQLKIKHLEKEYETPDHLLFRCKECLDEDICVHSDQYLCLVSLLWAIDSKLRCRYQLFVNEPSFRCGDCFLEDRCSHSDEYLSPADEMKIIYQKVHDVVSRAEHGYNDALDAAAAAAKDDYDASDDHVVNDDGSDESINRPKTYLTYDKFSKQHTCYHHYRPVLKAKCSSSHPCDHLENIRAWAFRHNYKLQSPIEYLWKPYLRCKDCLGRNSFRHSCQPVYICPRAVQNTFFELIQDSVKANSNEPSEPYIGRNGPAITAYRESNSGSHLVSTDLVPGIPIVNTNNKQWPLDGVLSIKLNGYITKYMEAHGKKTIEKCHFIPYGDFWKLTFVYCERDITKCVMQDPFRKLSYLGLKSMRGVTSEATPFENSILPSYILKVPFLREVLKDNSPGNHEPTEDVERNLALLFNGECSPGSAVFHRLLHLKETEESMGKAFDVVDRVEREGTAGRLTGLFIKNNLLRQPDDKAFQVVRRIKRHLQDFARPKVYDSEPFLTLFCFVLLICVYHLEVALKVSTVLIIPYIVVELFKAVFIMVEMGVHFIIAEYRNPEVRQDFIIVQIVKEIIIMMKDNLLLLCRVLWNFVRDLYGN